MGRGVEESLNQARGASDRALAQLDDPTALLLALEARRAGDAVTAQRLERAVANLRLDHAAAWSYVESGASAERLSEWGLDFQAVLQLERARQMEASNPDKAQELFAKAEAIRPLGGAVAEAVARWRLDSRPSQR